MHKMTILGGGGVRTPLLIHGLVQAQSTLQLQELALYDPAVDRANTIARLGRQIADGAFEITVHGDCAEAAHDAGVVVNSIRVGGIEARARDERIAIGCGLAGQETTGPGGAAMALRTIPVTCGHARIIEKVAPRAWFINFTNPAGIITQVLNQSTSLRVIGICDTPSELFYRLAENLRLPREELSIDYSGLNHLGWVSRVSYRNRDLTPTVLSDPDLIRRLYPADLFDPSLIQTIGLIPTEYLFFYYAQRKAHRNQLKAGASRGEEIARMNADLFAQLGSEEPAEALQTYRNYLLQRNASYFKLEAEAGSAFRTEEQHYDPLNTPTGYHRIALDVITALVNGEPREVVLNVPNCGAVPELLDHDIVEIPCSVDRDGAHPRQVGSFPRSVRGLVESVKQYERRLIHAALTGSRAQARLALTEYPIIGGWDIAGELLDALIAADPEYLGYLR